MNKQVMKKAVSVLSLIILISATQIQAQSKGVNPLGQTLNAITTAVPFLSIAPESRGGAMVAPHPPTSTPKATTLQNTLLVTTCSVSASLTVLG